MRKTIILISALISGIGFIKAQNALDAFNISQPDLKGTARYMGMAGAFGALGGDLTAITQNPGGIGVYRSGDIGFTVDLDLQKSTSQIEDMKFGDNQTKFLLNNLGAVLTLRLNSSTFPNLNFGFTYNKNSSFNRVYSGTFGRLRNSMSNYIAGIANADNISVNEVTWYQGIDPYNPGAGNYAAPWLTILGYDSYLMTPYYNQETDVTDWYGLWSNFTDGSSTQGMGRYWVNEHGGTNDYNIVIGGNISNILYWGMNFDIVNVDYRLDAMWEENLTNAAVPDENDNLVKANANWNLNSLYRLSGTGFKYQLGFILKPVQQLRFGFAFHTPTWYNLNEEFGGWTRFMYGDAVSGSSYANDGIPGYTSYNFRTPWKILASAAGVIGENLIVSFDYEWANYGKMHFSEASYGGGWYDPWDDPWYYPYSATPLNYVAAPNTRGWNNPYEWENQDISSYYKSSNTFRVGLEFKPVSALSIRAGYSYVSSPVKKEAMNNQEMIYTASMTPGYRFDNTTNYVTLGLGYRYKRVYFDLAYVYKHMDSEYHAYTIDVDNPEIPSPQSKVSFTNNQIVFSAGYRF